MRRLQGRASPFDEAIDVRAGQFDRGHVQSLLAAAAPYGHLHGLLVGSRTFDLSKPRHDIPVDREHEIALFEESRSGRAAHHAHHRQNLPLCRIVLGKLLRPLFRQSDFPCARQRLDGEFGFE